MSTLETGYSTGVTDDAPLPNGARPRNVVEALAAVMRDLPGIGRDEKSEQGYQYRGIEAITREAQRLLGRYGVVFVPKILKRTTKELTINSRPWTEDTVKVIYTVYGPGGLDDRITVGPMIGVGRDNSDKGVNKCMTQAFKYALIQTLCIGDAKDDADRDVAHAADPVDASPAPNSKEHGELLARLATIKQSDAAAAALRELWIEPDEHGNPTLPPSSKLRLRHMPTAWALVESVEARIANGEFAGQPVPTEPETTEPVAQTLDDYETERAEARARHDAEIARLNAEREPEAVSADEAKALAEIERLKTGVTLDLGADDEDPFTAAGLAHPEQFRSLQAIVAFVSALDDKTELRLRLDDLGVKWAGGHNLDSLRKLLAEQYARRDGLT